MTVFVDQDLAVTPSQYAKIKDLEIEHWHDHTAFCDAIVAMFPDFDFKIGTGTVTRIVVISDLEMIHRKNPIESFVTPSV